MTLTVVVGKRHVLAGFSLLVLSVLVGVMLITPMVSQGATVYTRSVSCAGLDFYPTDSDTQYDNIGSLRVRAHPETQTGSGVFRCDPKLPNAAKVIEVQFTAQLQPSGTSGVGQCALRRSGLTAATAATAEDLASVDFGLSHGGPVRLSSSTITNARIDNSSFGYWLECFMLPTLPDDNIGIYGADVIYKIKASQG